MDSPEDNIIALQVDKEITSLFKNFLESVEDIRKDHSIMLQKLKTNFPPEIVEASDSLTDEKYEQIRKRILDKGNETKRNILAFLAFFDSVINKDRIAEATRKKVTKKLVISPTSTYNTIQEQGNEHI